MAFTCTEVTKFPLSCQQDITQVTLLCTWLVEIYINKLNELRDEVESATKSLKAALSSSEPGEDDVNELTSRQRRMQEEESIAKDEFRQFLKTYKDRLDHATTLNLIASHGRTDELLYFAELIGDYERVITHWLQERKWAKAIEVLGRQENLDLYYKFSPILVEHVPQDTVNAWIKQPHLNPRNLIPALLKYEMRSGGPDGQNQAIRYLQYVIQKLGNVDPSIHNYLLSLYVKNARYDDEAGLLSFLNAEREDPHYNLQYALRLCSQEGLTQACVYIYSAMGLYEQAVELALKHNDLELAQINADKPEDDDALRKKLWLRIARHVVEEKKDIRQAMEYLKHCELLKIEDILPFFPDFVLIDDFKEEICAALEEYNMHIRDLKAEMDEATKSAESIRLDIRELRNKYAVIPVAKRCDVCDLLLLTRQFYVFPCEHVFHADCLINYVTKDMNPRNSRRVLELQGQITKQITLLRSGSSSGVMTPDNDSGRRSRVDGASKELNAGIKQQLDQLKEELDEMVASECPYCGEIMVRSIDKPFIGDEEMGTVASWAL
ncbi:hypothetical protein HK102_006394 [Quaeritorhiza haematococci]|nr:hypothetical protein HK102_006394 [Quaeritorhiza haematococci]